MIRKTWQRLLVKSTMPTAENETDEQWRTNYSHAQAAWKKQCEGLKQQTASQLPWNKEIKRFVKEHDEITRSLVKTGPEFLQGAAIFGLPIWITSFPSRVDWSILHCPNAPGSTLLPVCSFWEDREHAGNYHWLKFHDLLVNMDWKANLSQRSLIAPCA